VQLYLLAIGHKKNLKNMFGLHKLFLTLMLLPFLTFAQPITFSPTQTPQQLVNNVLLGAGVVASQREPLAQTLEEVQRIQELHNPLPVTLS